MERLGDILTRGGWTTPPGSRAPAPRDNNRSTPPPLSGPGTCPLCGGVGFRYPTLPENDPDFGKAVPCACTRQEVNQQRTERLQRYSNLGALVDVTFDSTSPLGRSGARANQERFARVLEGARAYAAEPQGWLALTGSSGSGKTRIAAAIANAVIARGEPAFFVVVPDLLDHLRATYAPSNPATYDDLFEQVRDAPLLILDDLGTQTTTAWAKEKLFQLLNHRYSARMPTVVTISGSLEGVDERLRYRLTDPALVQVWALEQQEDVLLDRGALSLDRLSEMTFESFDPEQEDAGPNQRASLRTALRAAVDFAKGPEGWLVLTGPVGCGKTHLAASIANSRIKNGQPARLVVVPDLLDHLRATYAPQSNVTYDTLFDSIKNTSLLILDDLGTHSSSPWAEEKLFQLINYRYNARLPTVITTSLSLDEAVDISPGVTSRSLRR